MRNSFPAREIEFERVRATHAGALDFERVEFFRIHQKPTSPATHTIMYGSAVALAFIKWAECLQCDYNTGCNTAERVPAHTAHTHTTPLNRM